MIFKTIQTSAENYNEFQIDLYLPKSISVINLYNPCKKMNLESLNELLTDCPKNIIICGDFNAHNKLWGSVNTDSNGRVMEEFIQHNDLVLLNDGSPTRLDPHTGKFSALDLTMVSKGLASYANWQVTEDSFGSDHSVISFNFQLGPVVKNIYHQNKHPVKLSFKDANWELYRKEITKQLSVLDQTEFKMLNVQGKYDYFAQAVLVSADIMFAKKGKKHQYLNPVPWWNEECRTAIN